MCAYLDDIENVTNRCITKKQRDLIVCYVKRNRFFRLGTSEYKNRKREYKEKRVELRKEWERETKQEWPKYDSDVLDGKGKVVRKKGQYYDVHHIIELSFSGPDVWYNLFPARHPDEHQNGIHRKGSLASKIFYE